MIFRKNEWKEVLFPLVTPLLAVQETRLEMSRPMWDGQRRSEEYTIPTPLSSTSCLVTTVLLVVLVTWVGLGEPVGSRVCENTGSNDHEMTGAGLPYAIQVATILLPISATISTSTAIEIPYL